ncbi:hypothetical protein E1B28_012679 [Marasmius oreades]|nr:uncharacterized protein E1B28_012679 [Marasmius oreades]KAG7088709.1 hypothetical protein E1B28_012679 [Marasmius oreades]
MNDTQGENKTTESLSFTAKSSLQRMVHELLGKCDVTLDKLSFDQDLYDECKKIMASEYHLPSPRYPWFEKYLSVGVVIAFTSYAHLPRHHRVQIAVHTSFATALDDIFSHHHQRMESFNESFLKGVSQDDLILDGLAKALLNTSKYYSPIQSNLIVTSTLDFMTSLIMEVKIKKMESFDSPSFAAYYRDMSGVSIAFAMFIFPKGIDPATYIQCTPQIGMYINYMNDVLSFYKEEVAGEEENLVSMLAKESSITKYEAIQRIADDVAEAEKDISTRLAGNKLALDGWQSFKRGYVRFHTSSPRYKLDELFELPYGLTVKETEGGVEDL